MTRRDLATNHSALEPAAPDPDRARLAALELQLAQRERDLTAIKSELHRLQTRYLEQVGALYRKLDEIESATVEAEVRAGLRPPPAASAPASAEESAGDDEPRRPGCAPSTAAPPDLKAIFRNVAKTIHPDLGADGAARWRRHSLMAEANRAYAERDADRLRLILRQWERSPESAPGDGAEGGAERLRRRIAAVDERLVEIDVEFGDLRASAIWRLKQKIEDAREQGWDLFAEMIQEVTREIRRASARLAYARHGVRRTTPGTS